MGFLYSILLKLLYPTSVALVLLIASAVLRWRAARHSRSDMDSARSVLRPRHAAIAASFCFWSAVAVLFICGNGWLVGTLTRNLERQYPSLSEVHGQWSMVSRPSGAPTADAILVLSGGIHDNAPPRPSVEVGEAGDRLLYGAYLYREHRAPRIICTGNVATGAVGRRPAAKQMCDFLEMLGIPTNSVLTEIESENTYQHSKFLFPVFKKQEITRVLLVTSAMHMPRSVGVFRKNCPGIEFIPAPTDYRSPDRPPIAWYRHITSFIPTPSSLANFCEVAHEYLGMTYYKLRGWI